MNENKILGNDPLTKRDSIWHNFITKDETQSIPQQDLSQAKEEPEVPGISSANSHWLDEVVSRSNMTDSTSKIVPFTEEEELEEEKSFAEHMHQFVGFRLKEETYALRIQCIRSIIRQIPMTLVPTTPKYIEGIINLRGQIIPVVSLKKRFGVSDSEMEPSVKSRIIIAEIGELGLIGFVVDEVTHVIRLPDSLVMDTPPSIHTPHNDAVSGVARMKEGLLMILDEEKLLSI